MAEVVFIGLSGPSSSGKTTTAHLLRQLFPHIVQILHADDFCKEFEDIPMVNGYRDCDGPNAIDTARMATVLDYMDANNGELPTDFSSWQEDVFPGQAEKALAQVDPEKLEVIRGVIKNKLGDTSLTKVVIVEGSLLYHDPAIRERLDLKLLLRLSHDTARSRRFTRQGYGAGAKPGEFWKTEDYFEKMVWPNYVKAHAPFFENGDVEGTPNREERKKAGINVQKDLDSVWMENLVWAVYWMIE